MEEFIAELLAELEVETAFTVTIPKVLPLLGGFKVEIAESVAVTWIIMAVVFLVSVFLTRDLKVNNVSRRQLIAETIVVKLENFVEGMVGEHGKVFVPYLATVLVFLGLSNTIGIFGMKPPTKDMNVTAALSLMSIVLIEYASVKKRGWKGYFGHFKEPIAIVTPINILELFIKPLSLCMRLFGNVLGAFVIMELIKLLIPVAVPIPFCFYFDVFDGLLQAYVFVFLTSLYIKEAIE